MQRHRGLISWLLVAMILLASGAVGAPSAVAQAPVAYGARLLSSSQAGVEFEVRVPWEQLSVQPITVDGKEFDSVTLPGWASTDQAGAPALPYLVQTIGVPFGVTVSVDAVGGEGHTVALAGPIVPAVTQSVEWGLPELPENAPSEPQVRLEYVLDSAVYDGGANHPGVLARVSSDGVIRQQRVAGIAAYPVQYDPTRNEVTVYESLTIVVRFDGQAISEIASESGSAVVESAAYEELYSASLLNYATAREWRATTTASVMPSGIETDALPWAPPEPGWRIRVRADAMYKLTYTQLQTAGVLAGNPDPRTFKMYYLGNEIAIYVEGEADGSFGTSDYILFYGQAVQSKYTRDNIYWLTYGAGNGLRMTTRDCTPGNAQTPVYFRALRHNELTSIPIYNGNAPGSADLDRWMGDYLYPPSRSSINVTFALPGAYTTGDYTGELRVAMLGAITVAAVNPDHHVRVSLNGTQVADVTWDGINWQNLAIPFAQRNLLVAGTNTITLTGPNDLGVGVDYVQVDWVEIEFANQFVAEAGELAFSFAQTGTWKFQASGYTSNQVAVYDVTNPTSVVRVTGAAVTGAGSAYSVAFQDSLTAAKSYRALQSSAFKSVAGIEADTASNLRSTGNGADYILVTHPNFAAAAQTLHNLRTAQNLRSKLVHIQDVYDEFGYGITGVDALQGFLAYAYASWQSPAPSYVVLMGDGHYDPKTWDTSHGRTSYIHPYLAPVDPYIVETAADNRYVAVAGADIMPDMMLGRLAVNSAAEATAIVNKIVAYDQSPTLGDWRQTLLAVTDNSDYAGNFPLISDALISACVPSSWATTRVYLGVTHTNPSDAKAAVVAGINQGAMFVNYIGHGYTDGWSSDYLLKTTDIAGLANGGKQPVVLAMDCRDGYYIYPSSSIAQQAMAEVTTRADGKGAIASWSPTGMGVASGHDYLNRGFLDAWFDDADGRMPVGQATMEGKLDLFSSGTNLDLIDTFLLFGDPATVLYGTDPTSVELLSFTGRGLDNAVALRWVTSDEVETAGYNLYRARWPRGAKTKLNAQLIPTLSAPGSLEGGLYRYRDAGLRDGVRYYYWLEIVDLAGRRSLRGPIAAMTK